MEIPEHRKWMDNRMRPDNSRVTDEFLAGVCEFVEFACAQDDFKKVGKLRCPCKICKCRKPQSVDDVMKHLCMKGFKEDYYYWSSHGEQRPSVMPVVSNNSYYGSIGIREDFNNFEQMVMDAAGPSLGYYLEQEEFACLEQIREDPDPQAESFFKMLKAAQAPLYHGCESYSELSAAIQALSIKSDFNNSQNCFNKWVEFMGKALPNDNRMPKNYYRAKKSVEKLGLGCIKIHCCPNGCMIYYYPEDKNLRNCKICGENRYKSVTRNGKIRDVPLKKMWYFPIIPRLQRLYSSMQTASQMRWHHDVTRDDGYLSHPADGEAWKHFDESYPEFAKDPRNVRLGLCADGFAPFDKTGRTYSCWPVVITPYNLPPWMCMKREFLFLTVLIPGPSNPKGRIDVYMQPLIDDLKLLWNSGVMTYDVSLQQNFVMKACLLWTINDFPAYGMLSGWMTMGRLACPICMESTKAFTLQHSHKTTFFDCHRQFLSPDHCYRRNKTAFRKSKDETSSPPKRLTGEEMWERVKDLPSIIGPPSDDFPGYGLLHNWTKQTIFWQLPYWKTNLLPHNLDVMHIERNVFLNILYTIMDTKGKTKDTCNARLDLADICRRKDLELQDVGGGKLKKPKAKYALTKQQRLSVCEWVRKLKLPDGYASTLCRCVDLREAKLFGMKSHDCHVFMQRLLPIAFRSLPDPIWNTLTEFSQFFRELTSPILKKENLHVMEKNIPIILCKLEQIFPPSFFDSMEHLPIHLPYEARVGGPVQYRWMYPFERFIRTLKDKVTNSSSVEGSICEAYLVEEASTFASYYYPPDVTCRRTRVPRNDDGGESCSIRQPLSIFNYFGRPSGKCTTYFLQDKEMKAAHLYVLLNCPEVEPFLSMYTDMLQDLGVADSEVDKVISTSFPNWFSEYVSKNHVEDNFLRSLAWGPKRKVNKWSVYYVNGYKFNTIDHGNGMSTTNCGVSVQGGEDGEIDNDYYGVLTDIVEVYYTGWPIKTLVLFKCDWFDPTLNQGKKVDSYGNVEVRASRKYKHYDPFIFAQQAKQVYFTQYPEGKKDWLAVIKTKARSTIQTLEDSKPEKEVPYQDESITQSHVTIENDNLEGSLVDLVGEVEEAYGPFLDEVTFEWDKDIEVEDSANEDDDDDDDDDETYSD